jgi:hypothetical protein
VNLSLTRSNLSSLKPCSAEGMQHLLFYTFAIVERLVPFVRHAR